MSSPDLLQLQTSQADQRVLQTSLQDQAESRMSRENLS